MFPTTRYTVMVDEEESWAAIVNPTTQPSVQTIFAHLLSKVKKMNANFTNIHVYVSYSDEDEPLTFATDQNKDEAGDQNMQFSSTLFHTWHINKININFQAWFLESIPIFRVSEQNG